MAVKGPEEVFIHAIKANELAEKEFRENGEISFVLSKSGFKRLKKIIDLEKDNFGTKGKQTWLSKIRFFLNGVRWFMRTMYGVFFDSCLENCSNFYIIHKSVINEIQEHEYSENKKCTDVTFIRKKNPRVSWLSGIENVS